MMSLEPKTMFLTMDFYSFGHEAGKAWREQYPHAALSQLAAEMQGRVYHLTRDHFPGEIVSAWQQGFRDGAMEA